MLNTFDKFIIRFPLSVQKTLKKIRVTIKQVVPNAQDCFVYGVPGFKLNGKLLINFSAFKNHIGLYPTPSVIEHFKKELSLYKTSKGAIQFPLDKPIPYDLIEKIAKYRVKIV
jgi:uncharacterized protein YdhG (YjbR/CyaY superfamily)